MPRPLLWSWIFVATCVAAPLHAQTPPAPGYSLQANTRVVLADVTVTDNQGHPVRGLKPSDFRVLDNKRLQQIASFEEHRAHQAQVSAQPGDTPGIYSNDYLVHPPTALNVLFLDLSNISLEDQGILQGQLDKFIQALTPDTPVAIYARTSSRSFLLQGFTADRALLRKAVHTIIPHYPLPDYAFSSDSELLEDIASYIGEIPGRKNVLWFTGGSSFLLRPDPEQELAQLLQPAYDALEAERVAIYPIDVRGLMVRRSGLAEAQHSIMLQTAEATGGRAVINTNGIAASVADIVDDDGNYYTLTYTPQHLTFDNKWHRLRISVPGTDYTLSYRTGYFADGNLVPPPTPPVEVARTRLLPQGKTVQEQITASKPILFRASATQRRAGSLPQAGLETKASLSKGWVEVHYDLPLEVFERKQNGAGRWEVHCGAAALAFNLEGRLVARGSQQITFTLRDAAVKDPAGRRLPVDIQLELKQKDASLYLAVWDLGGSGRTGWMQIPYHAAGRTTAAAPQP